MVFLELATVHAYILNASLAKFSNRFDLCFLRDPRNSSASLVCKLNCLNQIAKFSHTAIVLPAKNFNIHRTEKFLNDVEIDEFYEAVF